jgi:hypothetical protein
MTIAQTTDLKFALLWIDQHGWTKAGWSGDDWSHDRKEWAFMHRAEADRVLAQWGTHAFWGGHAELSAARIAK